jgi:sugar lactone lactonase YvrE
LGTDNQWEISAQTDDRLGESILWHPIEEALYWIDFYGPFVHRQKRAKGPVESWKIELGETMGSLVFAESGCLLLAVDHGLHLFNTGSGATRFFGDPKNGQMDLAYNDGKVDRAGRYWVGTYHVAETLPRGIFYRVAADGSAEVADNGFVICNGPAFSPDNLKLYFSDTMSRRILSYNLDRDGAVSGRRTFFTFSADDGMPDGLTVDSVGNVWCALYGGGKVVCIDPKGTLKLSLPLPTAYVTSLCFGGPELTTLFVTTGWSTSTEATTAKDSGGAVFMRPVDNPGLPEPVIALVRRRG